MNETDNIWFWSDPHFGHKNISGPEVSQWKNGFRDFSSPHEMNKTLTEAVNKYVKQDDTLYILGDFAFGDRNQIPSYRHSIVCQNIHLITGNHDHWPFKYADLFTSVHNEYWRTKITGFKLDVTLCHYAMRVWYANAKGAVHLYGHSHNSMEHVEWGRSMDVGADAAYARTGEYRPTSATEVLNILGKRDIKAVDHHDFNTNIK